MTTIMQHVTATAHGPNFHPFVSGCTCGWVGPERSCFQTAEADRMKHAAEASKVPMTLPVGFKDWHQRVAEDEAA